MRAVLLAFAAAAALILAFWAFLGAPVAMPPSPLGAGGKLQCVSYAPFRGRQSPLEAAPTIGAQQIDEDLARLSRITDCVRTYSVDYGLDQIPALARKHGLKVLLGLWLSRDADKNRAQIDTAVRLANAYRDVVRAVVVGNEVLLRGEMSAADLAATIARVKAQVTVPVTYADVWEFWLRNRELYPAVDFVTIHILPYWEDIPVAAKDAAAHVNAIRAKVAAAFPEKEIFIGEVGWPSAGRMRDAALPSRANEARVLQDVIAVARAGNYRYNVIEAFDQPWKRQLEGTVGGYWGILDDAARAPKFGWGEPVSDFPHWPLQAAVGIALAGGVLAAAWFVPGAERGGARLWVPLAGTAALAGALFGWSIEKTILESLGAAGWAWSLFLLALAVLAPLACAGALAAGVAVPSFAELLGGTERKPESALAAALGGLFVALTVASVVVALGLVFDPRYRDFPFPQLGAAVGPCLALLLIGPQARTAAGAAERVAAALLAASAVFIGFNEGWANWQAQALALILLAQALGLLLVAGGRNRE